MVGCGQNAVFTWLVDSVHVVLSCGLLRFRKVSQLFRQFDDPLLNYGVTPLMAGHVP